MNSFLKRLVASSAVLMAMPLAAFAGEADLKIPDLGVVFNIGGGLSGTTILTWGLIVSILGMVFGLVEFIRIKNLPAHKALLDISSLIYETCKTYMITQGKFLMVLEIFIGACIVYYFGVLEHFEAPRVLQILGFSILGILGSYSVAWFGIRINTYANSRTAYASLQKKPYGVMDIPLRSGMSIGVLLICVELAMMIAILLFVSPESQGASFIGFAIGESLGASALRICGGIFTNIADIFTNIIATTLGLFF
jgi:K(+)-stimulated pyrophosphate-energized sodium pump